MGPTDFADVCGVAAPGVWRGLSPSAINLQYRPTRPDEPYGCYGNRIADRHLREQVARPAMPSMLTFPTQPGAGRRFSHMAARMLTVRLAGKFRLQWTWATWPMSLNNLGNSFLHLRWNADARRTFLQMLELPVDETAVWSAREPHVPDTRSAASVRVL
jgi:hypothetical protein